MAELVDESAVTQLQALSQERITARALLEAHVARHQAVHAKLNAVVRTDLPRARAQADAVDAARAAGQPLGPLAGLPMTVKDGYDVDGMPARAGAPQLASRPTACAEGPLVTRLRAAGAVLWGKTNVPYLLSDCQSFNPLDGTTNNPFDVTRTPGGSSGGAAAALAAGVTPLELGSDIGGSLRNPASFCGVLALKPTQGRLSMEGHVPPMPGLPAETDLVVPGPMARTAADLRLLWEVLAGEATPRGEIRGLKVAVWPDEPRWPRSEEAVQALQTVAAALEALGLTVAAARPEVDAVELTRLYQALLDPRVARYLPPATRTMAWLLRPLAGLLASTSDDLWNPWRSVSMLDGPPEGVAAAERRRDELKGQVERFFGHFDVLLMPNAPLVAFPHDHSELILRKLTIGGRKVAYANFLNWILPATALHLPALSLPSGLLPSGLPIGVQLVAPWGAEARLLDLAQALEPKLGGFRAPPLDRLRA